jgi:long-chain fatty acid transport protein
MRGAMNILAPGVVQAHLTIGGTWTLNATNDVSAGFMHSFKKTVNGANSIPPSFGGGEANVSLEENSLSVGYAHYF